MEQLTPELLSATDAKLLVNIAPALKNELYEKAVSEILLIILNLIKKESLSGKSYLHVENEVCSDLNNRKVFELSNPEIKPKIIKKLRSLGYQVSPLGFFPFMTELLVSWY